MQSAIAAFLSPEILPGRNAVRCPITGRIADASKQIKLLTVPQVLVVQIKRFKYNEATSNYDKDTTKITCEQSLRIGSAQFTLCSVIVHHGGIQLGHGHYTAITQQPANWTTYDDARPSRHEYMPLDVNDAYIALCRKI